MEVARALGGDPLTIVSEMPLFLVESPPPGDGVDEAVPLPVDLESRKRFRAWAQKIARKQGDAALDRAAIEAGIRPMPIRDQMRLQLRFIEAALSAVRNHASGVG